MSRRRIVRAASLLVVLFTSMSLGVCAALDAGGKLPCCAKVGDEKPSFTACCATGELSSSSELVVGLQAPLPPALENAFRLATRPASNDLTRGRWVPDVPHRSADPQALLSTFLI
jgi:hypothetical protein